MQKIIGESIGLAAVVLSLFIFAAKRKENILKLKFTSDILWMANYILLGGYTGAVLNIVAIARETVFYLKGRKRFASYVFWLPVFMALSLISPVSECLAAGRFIPVTLLPAIGSMLIVVALYQDDPKRTRYIVLVGQTAWIIYSVCLNNISAVVAGSFTIVSALIGIARDLIAKRKESVDHAIRD